VGAHNNLLGFAFQRNDGIEEVLGEGHVGRGTPYLRVRAARVEAYRLAGRANALDVRVYVFQFEFTADGFCPQQGTGFVGFGVDPGPTVPVPHVPLDPRSVSSNQHVSEQGLDVLVMLELKAYSLRKWVWGERGLGIMLDTVHRVS
jgi:hypothetical protein